MSRRMKGAHEQLENGFTRAARLFENEDYFQVRQRHDWLKLLPLTDTGRQACDLEHLLREARVIQTLKSNASAESVPAHDPHDITG
jgi:hypothetical protein